MVPGRSCGSCNVCCIVPKIDEPALRKLPGHRCHNALEDGACAIYEQRPQTCRGFFCGWRHFDWIDEQLRPDLSGIFVRVTRDPKLVIAPHQFALMVTILSRDSLDSSGLIESLSTAVTAGVATYLVVPGPPGYTSCHVLINHALGKVVAQDDAAGVRNLLTRLYAMAVARLDRTRPVILTASDADDGDIAT